MIENTCMDPSALVLIKNNLSQKPNPSKFLSSKTIVRFMGAPGLVDHETKALIEKNRN